MPVNFHIKNATLLYHGHSHHSKKIDVLIKNGKLEKVGKNLKSKYKEISGKDLHVSMGWHDLRCHLTDPGNEHKDSLENLLETAAAGGFTSISTLPNSEPVVDSKSIVNYIKKTSASHLTEVYPYGAISEKLENKNLAEMYDMQQAGAVAFTDGDITPSSAMLKKALLYAKPFSARIVSLPMDASLHQLAHVNESENTIHTGLKSSSSLAEYTIVSQQLEIAKYCETAIHFSGISCKESVDLIKKAKRSGQKVTCDTTIFNLCFSDVQVVDFDENFKLYPLLRTEKDRKALCRAVYEEVIDAISTNHCPQNEELKKVEFDYADYGALSHQLVLSWYLKHLQKSIDIDTFNNALSSKPRTALGIELPELKVDEEVNLVVYDLDGEWEFNNASNLSNSKNSHEIGNTQLGKVLAVFNNNKSKIVLMDKFKPSIKYGLIMSAISILIFMLIYAFNFEMMGNWKYLMLSGLISMLILPILFFILACRDAKPNFKFFSFGKAFQAAFYTGVVFTIVNLVFTLLLMNVIDPDFQDNLKDIVVDNMQEQFDGMSMDDEQVDEIMAKTEKSFEDQKGLWGQTKGSIFGLFWFAIISLIIAAANKDKKENFTSEVNEIGD